MARKAKPPTMLRFPVRPDDPVIAFINWMIQRYTDDLNAELSYLRGDSGKITPHTTEPMRLDHSLTHRENCERSDTYYIDPRRLESLQKTVYRIEFLEKQINDLVQLKLRLFDEVDFPGGSGFVREINKVFRETQARVASARG